MAYIFMAIHYPEAGHGDVVRARMGELAHPGERRPREYLHLIQADA